jgi:Chromo (CHRromatin Organisation MOdifier) domain
VSVELKAYLQYQENTLYVVEEFLELKKVQSGIQVLVKWMGFESAENSWEPIETLVEDAPDLLRDFLTTTSSVLAPDVLSLL